MKTKYPDAIDVAKSGLDLSTALYKEHNDCSVRALVLVTGKSYNTVHAALATNGRKRRCGAYHSQYIAALRELGYRVSERHDLSHNFVTVRTLRRELLKPEYKGRNFLIKVRGHVMGFNGHDIIDFAYNSLRRIIWVKEVNPNDKPRPKHNKVPDRLSALTELSIWNIFGLDDNAEVD